MISQDLPDDGTYITVEGEHDMPLITNDVPLEKIIPILDDNCLLYTSSQHPLAFVSGLAESTWDGDRPFLCDQLPLLFCTTK